MNLTISAPSINPLNTESNSICSLLALLETHHILHVSRIRVKDNCETKNHANVWH
jgi:hypothetical protein